MKLNLCGLKNKIYFISEEKNVSFIFTSLAGFIYVSE